MPSATGSTPETPTPVTNVANFPDPSGYTWSPVGSGFTRPVDLTHAGDERLFVVEQQGIIWVIDGGATMKTPFLDIRERVNDRANEQGLLGLAFHPNYAANGTFFVNYSGSGGETIISRFQALQDRNLGDPGSEFILLTIAQPFGNHNGGSLIFGPDGFLYIGTGDGGSANDPQGNGQSLDTLLGKILRIDVDTGEPYSTPEDNPFATGNGSAEIWAYGMRNPWRMSFDRLTGDLYIGDVGQNQWEEIDFQEAGSPGGLNFGWNLREGMHPFASDQTQGLIDPIAEYGRGGGCSVTGGFVVRSPSLPTWNGVYLFGDYCSGTVWGLLRKPAGEWEMERLFETGLPISSFGENYLGEIFLVSHSGEILRLDALP
jgi:glucose/arabinose dehydrogenase